MTRKKTEQDEAAAQAPGPDDHRQGQRRLIGLALSGSVNNALFTSVTALFLLSLGATPFQVGLLASATHLQRATRFVGLYLIPRIGKAQLMFWGRAASVAPTLALIGLALYLQPGPAAVWLALVMVSLRGLLQQTGNTAWWPLIQDNTAGGAFGHFLARMRMAQRALELVLPLGVGWYLGTRPPAPHFTPLFALSLLATFLGAWWVRRVPERVQAPTGESLLQRLWRTIGEGPVKRLSLYMVFYMALHSMGHTFWVVALTERGVPYMYFVWFTSVGALAQLACLTFWGRLVDRRGGGPAVTAALGGMVLLAAAWVALPGEGLYLLAWSGAIFFFWGVIDGAHQMGRTHIMMQAVSPAYQAEGFSVIMYGASLGGIVGGLAGGAAFEYVQTLPVGAWDPELIYLAAVQTCYVGIYLFSRSLPNRSKVIGDGPGHDPSRA